MPVQIDLTGQVFGRLTALCVDASAKTSKRKWICICSCGKEMSATTNSLKSGNTSSCGCKRTETIKEVCTTHGLTGSQEYQIWTAMKSRCYYSDNKHYDDYGGRGILVCSRWLNSFENFYEDMGRRPSIAHSIERRNVNQNYGPDNCYWATATEQARNKTTTRYIEYNGRKVSMAELSEILKVDYDALKYRLNLGYTPDQAAEEICDNNRPKRISRQ